MADSIVRRGASSIVTLTSTTDLPPSGTNWQIISDDGSTILATDALPAGWNVTNAGSGLVNVTVPNDPTLDGRTGFKVRISNLFSAQPSEPT